MSRNVKCDLKNAIQICLLQKLFKRFIFVIMLDNLIVSFFDRLISLFSDWRMLIFDYWVTHVCSRFVERRLWWNDSLNMMKAFHQTWWKKRHLIKFDEKTSSHQIWRKRFIKLLKKKTIILLSDKQSFAATFDVKNLVLQKIIFDVRCLCKIIMINERF